MKIIGITGGVGAGKSSILEFLKANYNCEIAMADNIAKDMYKAGNPCVGKLVSLFGEDILAQSGDIDIRMMANRMYSDPSKIESVNEIVHPMVRIEIENRIKKARNDGLVDYFFLEAALLIEAGYKPILDELWYVYVNSEARYERLSASRGYTREKIDTIVSEQLSDEEFRANADFVIDNSFDIENSINQIRERMKCQ